MKSLLIGKSVKHILQEDQELRGLIGDKVFPLVADKGCTFPFIVYRRENLQPSTNKDALIYDTIVKLSIMIATDNYTSGLNIASKVADILGNTTGRTVLDLTIGEIVLTDTEETYQDETYLQVLNFNLKIIE